jgi:UDP-hydrolysing UDP-N-acetyl-D-glucosamine 2-epimerase
MKKIIFVTTSRADYGILKGILSDIEKSKNFESKLLVTGSHLLKKYGFTLNEILKDKLRKTKIIKLKVNDSTQSGLIYMSIFKKFYYFLKNKKIDYIFLIGDRFEVLAVANVCLLLNIPIIHLHGGEITLGAIDDSIRHSISKIAKIHFVSNIRYKQRLIQLGENPKNIFVSGSPSIEKIKKINLFSKKEIEKKINIKLDQNFVVVTVHPETRNKAHKNIENIFKVLKKLKNFKILITMPNFDEGSILIQKIIKKYIDKKKFFLVKSLGHKLYLSLIKHSSGSIGNSSSNIIELPSLKKGAINLGDRQNGRLMAKNIINSSYKIDEFKKSLKKLLSKKFIKKIDNIENPYFKKNSSKYILQKILKLKNVSNIKEFNDLIFNKNVKFKLMR